MLTAVQRMVMTTAIPCSAAMKSESVKTALRTNPQPHPQLIRTQVQLRMQLRACVYILTRMYPHTQTHSKLLPRAVGASLALTLCNMSFLLAIRGDEAFGIFALLVGLGLRSLSVFLKY